MQTAIIGKKVGMTSLFTADGEHIPVTVVEAGPCPVVLKRTEDKDGYEAIQLGFGETTEKRTNKPMMGQFTKAGVKPTKVLKEFRDVTTEYNVGDTVTVEAFTKGDRVHVSGTSKGRGFAGVMRRHNFSGVGMATHGQKNRQRHPGSIGMSSDPSRVLKGMRMGGQMGNKKTTTRNLEIVEVIPDKNLILVRGSVPGAPNSLLEIVKQ